MSSSDYTNTEVYEHGKSEDLIVFVHGYGPFAKRHLRAIAKAITGKPVNIVTTWDRVEAILALLLVILLCGVFIYIPFFVWSILNLPDLFNAWLDQSGLLTLIGLAKFSGALILMIVIALLSVGVMFISLLVYYLRASGSFAANGTSVKGQTDNAETDTEETYGEDSLGYVIRKVMAEEPDADLLIPFYDAGIYSNADVFLLASRLEDMLQRVLEERERRGGSYGKIILIGHSLGALLVRKAYVYGLGATEDHPVFQRTTDTKRWARIVDRLVLLAPMNRGWALWPRPKHMTWIRLCLFLLVLSTAKVTARARLLRSVRRGTPFVSNLRIQWIRLCRERADDVAPLIMLLGDTDDMVRQEDNQDVSASEKFIFIPVPSSGHGSIVKFHKGKEGEVRIERFLKALKYSIPHLEKDFLNMTKKVRRSPVAIVKAHSEDDLRKKGNVVFVLHGIRDFGDWTKKVGKAIRKEDSNVSVITSSYGYFPIFRFLLFGSRQRNVQLFMDWYTEAFAASPDREMSFIGHSNGTYILANAIKNYVTLSIKNAAFVGSVIPRNFPWDHYIREKRISAVRNDVSAGDWIVGIFARFFEVISEVLGVTYGSFGDIGSSGFHGFTDNSTHEHEHKYFPGGHSAALKTTNYGSLAKFVLTGKSEIDATCLVEKQSKLVVLFSKLSILIIPVLSVLIFLVGYWTTSIFETVWGVEPVVSWLGFLLVLVILLSVI